MRGMHGTMRSRAHLLIVSAAAILLLAGAAPAAGGHRRLPDTGFPYWPAAARSGRPVPLRGGAAFRSAIRKVTAAARRAGWVRIGWDQTDGGSVRFTFARPEPSKTTVTLHLHWAPRRRRGRLRYTVGTRKPWVVVDGFPLCPDTALGTHVRRSHYLEMPIAAVDCDRHGFAANPEVPLPRFPRVYGWKALGHGAFGILYVRAGTYVEVTTGIDLTRKKFDNSATFMGHHDPRKDR